MKTTEQYLIDTLNKRVTELVKDKTFQAEVIKHCKTKDEAKEYAHYVALWTLMYSVEEREKQMAKN